MPSPRKAAIDPVLHSLLEATDIEAERAIGTLLTEVALPVVDRVLVHMSRRFGVSAPDKAGEIRSEVALRLLERLRAFRAAPDERAIVRFQDYVVVTTRNAVNAHARTTFPRHARLKGRIRYLIERSFQFEVWNGHYGIATAGRKEWRDWPIAAHTADAGSAAPDLRDAVYETLERLDGPIALDRLVALVAGARDEPDEERAAAAAATSWFENLESAALLRHLWTEIIELPRKQRVALLLNLRGTDGESVAHFLPVTRVATVREIAKAVEMDPLAFAELWDDLPLEDARLAELLHISRQNVINLRKAARARLARRLSRKSGGSR
jgi:hypothetical protein